MAKKRLLTTRSILTTFYITACLACVLGYTLFAGRYFISGPVLILTGPDLSSPITTDTIVLSGTADRFSYLYLNDKQIFVNPEKVFSEELLLQPGHTIIELAAHDRFGRKETKTISLFYNPTITNITYGQESRDKEGSN